LPGATRNSRGGLLCQSAHINRASAAAPKRTGFRSRMKTVGGRKVLAARRKKGPPSPYTRVKPGWSIRAKRGWCKRRSFDAVYRAGKRRSSSHFTAFLKANNLPQSRFGFQHQEGSWGRGCAQSNPAAACEKSRGCTGRSYPRDGTSSFIRRVL